MFYDFSNVPGVFGNQQNNYLDLIKQMLQQSLIDTSNGKVRMFIKNFRVTCFSTSFYFTREFLFFFRLELRLFVRYALSL